MCLQADIYHKDFEEEREARQAKHREKEQLVDQMTQLQLENQQLQDEIQSFSLIQFSEMQRRHGGPSMNPVRKPYDTRSQPQDERSGGYANSEEYVDPEVGLDTIDPPEEMDRNQTSVLRTTTNNANVGQMQVGCTHKLAFHPYS